VNGCKEAVEYLILIALVCKSGLGFPPHLFAVKHSFAAVGLVSPAPLQAWQLIDRGLKHVAMPTVLHLDAATDPADFDEDGLEETLTSTGSGAAIWAGS
jgi:hypothetical protein